MTKEERDAAIEQIKADPVMPLPRRYKAIERIMAEYKSLRNPDHEQKDRERARYQAFDSVQSNV